MTETPWDQTGASTTEQEDLRPEEVASADLEEEAEEYVPPEEDELTQQQG